MSLFIGCVFYNYWVNAASVCESKMNEINREKRLKYHFVYQRIVWNHLISSTLYIKLMFIFVNGLCLFSCISQLICNV